MYLQGVESIFDLIWTHGAQGPVTYGDVFHQNEVEMSAYNFEYARVDSLLGMFDHSEAECETLVTAGLPLPAYEMVLKASHAFNLLDARHAISVTERQHYILRVRNMARSVAENYYERQESLGFPLLDNQGLPKMASKSDFLFEIGTEELPPKSLCRLRDALRDNLSGLLNQNKLDFDAIRAFATPRRLAILVSGLAAAQPDSTSERKGPRFQRRLIRTAIPPKRPRVLPAVAGSVLTSLTDRLQERANGCFSGKRCRVPRLRVCLQKWSTRALPGYQLRNECAGDRFH